MGLGDTNLLLRGQGAGLDFLQELDGLSALRATSLGSTLDFAGSKRCDWNVLTFCRASFGIDILLVGSVWWSWQVGAVRGGGVGRSVGRSDEVCLLAVMFSV